MPAKTPDDLAGDLFIRCGKCEYEDGEGWEAVCVDAEGQLRFDVGWIRLNTHHDPWAVDVAETANGWGPLFYYLAMEVATKLSTGLRPHFRNVTDDAYAVWRHYFHQRPDVTHDALDEAAPFLHDEAARPELRFVYRKAPIVLPHLVASNKLWLPGQE